MRVDGEDAAASTASAAAAADGFARSLLAGDGAAAVTHFAPAGQLLTPDGTQVAGRQSILAVLEQLIAAEQELEIRSGRTILADAVALTTQYWMRRSRRRSGEPFEASHTARLVLGRHERGWQILIAAPWG
jgi:ketosteroid isomerase-like protein